MSIGATHDSPIHDSSSVTWLRRWGIAASIAVVVSLLVTPVGRAETPQSAAEDSLEPRYPLAVAVADETLFVVDLDLPGVWKVGEAGRELFVRGSRFFRKPLNRPRCVAIHPAGGILVGDSATREVYHIAAVDAEPQPLSGGRIGIAMALAVSPDSQTLFVGDAEQRAVLRLPIGGGTPESVVAVNARGLAFDAVGALWAVTPDDAAVQRIDVDAGTSETVISGRPFRYPNGLIWLGDHGLVTDGYSKKIWRFTAAGDTETWLEGDPLVGPVGIAHDAGKVFVADPKQNQLFEFDRQDKSSRSRL